MGHLYVSHHSSSGYDPEKGTPSDEEIWLAMSDPESKSLPKNEERDENEQLRAQPFRP